MACCCAAWGKGKWAYVVKGSGDGLGRHDLELMERALGKVR